MSKIVKWGEMSMNAMPSDASPGRRGELRRWFFRRGAWNRTALALSAVYLLTISALTEEYQPHSHPLDVPSTYLAPIVVGGCLYAFRQWERSRSKTNIVLSIVMLAETIWSVREVLQRGLSHADFSLSASRTIIVFTALCIEIFQLAVVAQNRRWAAENELKKLGAP